MNDQYDMGMVGLGVMGRNLVLNMAEHGFSVAGYDQDAAQVEAMAGEAGDRPILAAGSLKEMTGSLRAPRAVMMLVPAGGPVDSVIGDLLGHLEQGDLIIDGGNSFFKDTDRRERELAEKGLLYLGVGISGGESGARHGPSIMPGGKEAAYERVQPLLEASAANVDGDPCVTYLGPGSAGHYVKMVHNGIEYGIMQLIAETYDLMKRGLGLGIEEAQAVYSGWAQGDTGSFLLEITAAILGTIDDRTGRPLLEMIRDEAKQKGTGMWTSQDAMELQVPVPTIDIAVSMRNLSAFKNERLVASQVLGSDKPAFPGEFNEFLDRLKEAFYAAMILTYAQGMAQLRTASGVYGYDLDLEAVARIWRGGCIIRAALLEDIREAYRRHPVLANLLLDVDLGQKVRERVPQLRTVTGAAAGMAIPMPGFMVSLAYLDSYRSSWLPASLVQAQRDYFGAHTYERIDEEGVFHTQWERK